MRKTLTTIARSMGRFVAKQFNALTPQQQAALLIVLISAVFGVDQPIDWVQVILL